MKPLSLYLFFAMLLSACGGTNTGNPTASRAGDPAESLEQTLCANLAHCTTIDSSACKSALLADTEAPVRLGLSSAQYPNLQSVETALSAGTLSNTTTHASTCLNAVNNLTCSNAIYAEAYNSSHPNDYSQVSKLLTVDTSCGHYFEAP